MLISQEGKDFILGLYDSLGAYLIPIEHGTKHPPLKMGWTQYYEKRVDKETLLQWLEEYDAFALICGKEQGFYTVDFDIPKNAADQMNLDPKAQGLYNYLLEENPTWAQKSGALCGSRRHLIYKTDKTQPAIITQSLGNYPGVEIRGEKSLILVAYSRHPSGGYYEVLRNPLEDGIGILPYSFFSKDVETGDTKKERKEQKHTDPMYKVTEPGRHAYLIKEAGHYCRTTPRWKEVIISLNATHCDPPLPDYELDSIFASGSKYSKDVDYVLEEKERVLVDFKDIMVLDDLIDTEFPPVLELVGKCLLSSGGVAMMAGDPGVGKTFNALHLMECLSTGKNWLGHEEFTVPNSVKCLYLDGGESTNAKLQRRYKFFNFTRNRKVRLGTIDLTFMKGREEENNRKMDLLLDNMALHGETVVFFDSMRRFHNYKEGDPDEMKMLFKTLGRVRSRGILLVLIHHNRKGIHGSKENEMQKVSGSLEISANLDHLFTLTKLSEGKIKITQSKQRDLEEYQSIDVDMQKDANGKIRFRCLGTHVVEKEEEPASEAELAITRRLEAGKVSRTELVNLVYGMKGGSRASVDRILAQYLQDGTVNEVEKIGREPYYEYIQTYDKTEF